MSITTKGITELSPEDDINWSGKQTFSGDLGIASPTIPSSASDTGTAGDIAWASGFIYICVATNTWQRVVIASW